MHKLQRNEGGGAEKACPLLIFLKTKIDVRKAFKMAAEPLL